MDSARKDTTNVARLLIDAGADLNARCNGWTVLMIATEKNSTGVVSLLEVVSAHKRDDSYFVAFRGRVRALSRIFYKVI